MLVALPQIVLLRHPTVGLLVVLLLLDSARRSAVEAKQGGTEGSTLNYYDPELENCTEVLGAFALLVLITVFLRAHVAEPLVRRECDDRRQRNKSNSPVGHSNYSRLPGGARTIFVSRLGLPT